MAVVVNNPSERSSNSGLLTVVIGIVLLALLLMYGLPYLNNTLRGPSVNVPDKIDVNVNNPGNAQ